ncbi:MAG: hypothetical protein AAF392_02265 [Bacteroidota bacterium]
MHWEQPCAASDLLHFRKRLGKAGTQALFAFSVLMHGKKLAKAKEVLIDTTVEEKNITYPTDAKLYKKVIERCNTLAQRAGVKLRLPVCSAEVLLCPTLCPCMSRRPAKP